VGRLLFVVSFFIAFVAISVPLANGQAAAPVVAQQPVLNRPPGLGKNALAAQSANRVVATGQSSVSKPALAQANVQRVPGQAVKDPEQTKIVRIYRGSGYFDSSLADRLRPILTKDFATAVPNSGTPVTNVVNTLLGQNQAAPQTNSAIKPSSP
jgi:hypothetical protein